MLILEVILALFSGAATDVSVVSVNSTYATVNLVGASNLYAYEINLDYTGSIGTVTFYNFLSTSAGDTTKGHSERNSISSVYESRTDSAKKGISGSGNLFNISYSGTVALRYALFVKNDSSEEYVYYNTTSQVTPAVTLSTGGGGGGTGAEKITNAAEIIAAKSPVESISTDTKSINIDMILDSSKERIIKIINLGNKEQEINIAQEGLDNLVSFSETNFRLLPGESRDIRVVFSAVSEPAIYTGKIYIAGQQILSSINIRSKLLLFDASIIIPDDSKTLETGKKLNAQVTLIPMGDKPRVDVTINYVIKDFNGKTYLTESETFLVDQQLSFKKQFNTNNLPTGNYVIGIELIYPNGVATSSSHFQVSEKIPFNLQLFLLGLAIGILVLLFAIIILVIRYKKFRASMKHREVMKK